MRKNWLLGCSTACEETNMNIDVFNGYFFSIKRKRKAQCI